MPADQQPVTIDTFNRAETDRYMASLLDGANLGSLHHQRDLAPVDHQTVIRMNRDTVYSSGVFDLDAGPVTISLPESSDRFISLQAIDQDHYVVNVTYTAEPQTFDREQVGTRYLVVLIRTLVNPSVPGDLEQVHALQDAIQVQQSGPGTFAVPDWNQAHLDEIRNGLLLLAKHSGEFSNTFGTRSEVDPLRHLIGTAAGWGGNPDRDARYVGIHPANDDGIATYAVTVHNVPVDGFWSVSVYNARGFFEKNDQNAYTLNNMSADRNPDGSITINFGSCDGSKPNCIPITPGWNGIARLYRPRPEILDGTWAFPPLEQT